MGKNYLKPQGTFIIVDFHPILSTFDDQFEHLVTYSYFNHQSIVEYSKGTYANSNASMQQKSIRWLNHSSAETMTSLIEHHLQIDIFQEFDSLPLNCFHNLCQISNDVEQYQFKEFKGQLPLSYVIKSNKNKLNNKQEILC